MVVVIVIVHVDASCDRRKGSFFLWIIASHRVGTETIDPALHCTLNRERKRSKRLPSHCCSCDRPRSRKTRGPDISSQEVMPLETRSTRWKSSPPIDSEAVDARSTAMMRAVAIPIGMFENFRYRRCRWSKGKFFPTGWTRTSLKERKGSLYGILLVRCIPLRCAFCLRILYNVSIAFEVGV